MAKKEKQYDGEIYVSDSNAGMSCPNCGDPWGKMREVVFNDDGDRLYEKRCSNCCNEFKLKWN